MTGAAAINVLIDSICSLITVDYLGGAVLTHLAPSDCPIVSTGLSPSDCPMVSTHLAPIVLYDLCNKPVNLAEFEKFYLELNDKHQIDEIE